MIVPDEAQYLRSQKGRIVKTFLVLKAERKLAFSGAPISNTPEDLIKILSILEDEVCKNTASKDNVVQPIIARSHFGQIGGFEKDIGSLHDMFRRVLLRRDKNKTFNGVSIVSLKSKTIKTHLARFPELDDKSYGCKRGDSPKHRLIRWENL